MGRKLQLHQFLSKTGVFSSKKEVYEVIALGKVTVNGRIVRKREFELRPNTEKVEYDGTVLSAAPRGVYIAIYKPTGYLSSKLAREDITLGKKSVFELLKATPELLNTLFCVGRLDEDTSGLLIITNDGQLNTKIIHAQSQVKKTYEAALARELLPKEIERLQEGIDIEMEENGSKYMYWTKPCEIRVLHSRLVTITVSEGRKREVRRMFEAVENSVVSLKRVAIGGLTLSELGLREREFKEVEREFLEKKVFGSVHSSFRKV